MVLIDLVKGTPYGLHANEFPYTATFLREGKTFSYAIRDREHLIKRIIELDKNSVIQSDMEEIEQMVDNFSEVFLDTEP